MGPSPYTFGRLAVFPIFIVAVHDLPAMALPVAGTLLRRQILGSAYAGEKPGARKQLLDLNYALSASLELPSEAIQRMNWDEPETSAYC